MLRLWRVSVFEREWHTNPWWATNVRAPNASLAVICTMTHYQRDIGKVTVQSFDGYGLVSEDWTDA
jgi:hypothetical protein